MSSIENERFSMSHLIPAYSTDIEAERVITLENDYIVSNFISKQFQEFDRQGWKSKWFDYRHMTTLQATHAYMEAFSTVYKRIYAREFDKESAEYLTPVSFDRIMGSLRSETNATEKQIAKAKMQLVGCWRGRQIADMLCIPYEIYIDLAFTYRMRYWKQNTMPRPTHLYSEFVVEKIIERWEELQASRLYVAEHSAYLVQNYQDLPHQNDHHEWLFNQVSKRANPAELIGRLINEHLLPVEKVQSREGLPPWEMIERYLQ